LEPVEIISPLTVRLRPDSNRTARDITRLKLLTLRIKKGTDPLGKKNQRGKNIHAKLTNATTKPGR
jgi:hypothetical protein